MKKTVKNIFGLLLLGGLTCGLGAAEIAKYAGEFFSTGVGARALGMGGAFVAGGGDVTSGYWNPAGLTDVNYPEIAAMHSERFSGMVNYDYLGVAVPFRATESFAISGIRLGVDDIPITAIPRPDLRSDTTYTDENGNLVVNRPYVDHWVNDAEYAFFLSYARMTSAAFSYGINAKILHKGVGEHSAWGFGFDIGMTWNPWKKFMLGVNLQDVTTTILAWNTGTKELISPTLKTGIAYPFHFSLANTKLLLAADVDTRFENREFASQMSAGPVSFDFRVGGELLVYDVVALRLGRDDLGYLTAGAGLCLPRLDVDYSFMNHTDLKETHRISLRLRLEENKFARK